MTIALRIRAFAALVATALIVACSSKSDSSSSTPTTPNPTPTPAIAIGLSAASLSVTQGATANITVSVTRSGGYTGDVVVAVEGLPAGITASALTITAANTSGTITLTAAATATVAGANLTVRGTGTGVTSATANVALNVVAAAGAGAVAVIFSPTSLTIIQGATVNVTATITRSGGFTGPVTLAVTGAPAGLTVVITPTASANQTATVTTNSATLAFTAGTVAVGTYNIGISASGTGVTTNSVNFSTTVNPPVVGAGNTTFTFCAASGLPVRVAFQDGTAGTWTNVNVGAGNTYSFNITQSKGAVAYQFQQGATNNYQTSVFYGTQAELQAQGPATCANQGQTGKTLTGTATGVGALDFGSITLGSASASLSGSSGSAFTLNNVPTGALDLIASRNTINLTTGSIALAGLVFRRAQNFAAGAVIPVIDLSATGPEVFLPVNRTLTVNGLNGDQAISQVFYLTASGAFAVLSTGSAPSTAAAQTVPTVPANKQVSTDLHWVSATAAPNLSGGTFSVLRSASTAFLLSADKALTMGPIPSAVTITTVSAAAPVIINTLVPIQAEYNKALGVSLTQSGATPRSFSLNYTAGYIGGAATMNATVPNLTPAGFTASFGLLPGVPISVTTSVAGWTGNALTPFAEGVTYVSGGRLGSITP